MAASSVSLQFKTMLANMGSSATGVQGQMPIRSASQEALERKLKALSTAALDESTIDGYVEFFIDLYNPRDDSSEGQGAFRHSYSGVFTALLGDKAPSSLDEIRLATQRTQQISSNLDQIGEEIDARDCDSRVKRCFGKLRDHVQLDMQHLTMIEQAHIGLTGANESVSNLLESQRKRFQEQDTRFEKLDERMQNLQTQYVTILSVFAAVVLVFNGAVGFSTSSIQASLNAEGYAHIVFVTLIVGFILFSAVTVLLGFLWHVVKSDERLPRAFLAIALITDSCLVVGAIAVSRGWLLPLA